MAVAEPIAASIDRIRADSAVAEMLTLVVAASIGFLLAVQLAAAAALTLGAPLGAWLAPAAAGATLLALGRLRPGLDRAGLLSAALLTALVWLGAILLVGAFYDWSWDGQHYHQELVIQLAQGWNPVWETFRTEERGLVDGELALWLNHYPKAGGVAGAAVYLLTDAIETAKYLNPLLMALTGLYAAALLRMLAGLSWIWAGLLGLALASNAVAAAQMLSFYNDGALFCGLALIALAGAHLLARPSALAMVILFGAVALTVNLKFTGLVFAIGALGFIGMAALYREGGRIRAVLPLATLFAAALLLALLTFGPSPYLQNLWTAGHPFHPLMGENAFDIVTRSKPRAFLEISGPEALIASIFGAPELGVGRYEPRMPFTFISTKELKTLSFVDPRIGGWGPAFAEQLLIALAGAAALLLWARNRGAAAIGAFGLGATLFLALIHPEAWWARYSSFLLIGPWILFAAAAAAGQGWTRLLAALGLVLMFANNLPVAWTANAKVAEMSARIEAQVATVKAAPGPVALSLGIFHSNRIKLREAGVAAQIVPRAKDLPCAEPKPFFNGHWISRVCY